MAGICIALDAMGGDHGPVVVVPAALKTLAEYPNLKLILVGDRHLLEKELKKTSQKELDHLKITTDRQTITDRLKIVEAKEMVRMDEPPASALRNKRNSSMRIAIDLVKDSQAQACVSAGNTGALMAIARFVLKTLPGVDRPAIVNALPTLTGHTYVLDLGANVDCEAEHLLQFAVMGSILASYHDNKPRPSIGLLNVGSEAIKGSEQVKRAHELISALDKNEINYVGFVEGDDIFKGRVDVIVCDGFVGNVALKAIEGVAKMLLTFIKQEFTRHWLARLSAIFALPVLKALKRRFDPNQYNGASLLGLRGIVIKSHGSADIESFAMAIRVAILEVEENIPDKIQQQVSHYLGNVSSA